MFSLFLLLLLVYLPSQVGATVIHHHINYEGATVDGDVAFDFETGAILPGASAPLIGIRIIPSNSGQNMQVQTLSGSNGGLLITTGAPSYLADIPYYPDEVGANYPEDTVGLPGYSTASGLGIGRLTYFGSGEFIDGNPRYIGLRFDGGNFYGWAKISVNGTDSFTVHEIAYEDSGSSILSGDRGYSEGVQFYLLDESDIGGLSSEAWPAGVWEVGAVMLDAQGDLVGTLAFTSRAEIGPAFPGRYHPATSNIYSLADGELDNRIRLFRRLGSLAVGDVTVEYADFPCDIGGALADYCKQYVYTTLGADPSLRNERFAHQWATVPGFGEGASKLSSVYVEDVAEKNWPSGNWHVASIALDAHGRAVGELGGGFSFETIGRSHPYFTHQEVHGTLDPTDRIRIFRSLFPILPGSTGLEFADFPCDGTGADACDPLSGASLIGEAGGRLANDLFANVAPVPDGSEGPATLELLGTGDIPGGNWAVGSWYLRALFVNSAGQPATELSPQMTFNVSRGNFPTVQTQPFRSVPENYSLRVYRSSSPIDPADRGVEYADYPCAASGGGLEPWCDAISGRSNIGRPNGALYDGDFSWSGEVPSIAVDAPSLVESPTLVAWPNPFNPRVALAYELKQSGAVRLEILGINGRRLRVLEFGTQDAGSHQFQWDGLDDSGSAVASGIYHARLIHSTGQSTVKLTLVR